MVLEHGLVEHSVLSLDYTQVIYLLLRDTQMVVDVAGGCGETDPSHVFALLEDIDVYQLVGQRPGRLVPPPLLLLSHCFAHTRLPSKC